MKSHCLFPVTPTLKGKHAIKFIKELNQNKNKIYPKEKIKKDIELFFAVLKKFKLKKFK